jgi:hypothetical protein
MQFRKPINAIFRPFSLLLKKMNICKKDREVKQRIDIVKEKITKKLS